MVWYPSVDDIVCLNILVLEMTGNRHPHRLLGSREGLQAVIEEVRREEARGLTYQAALLMKELAGLHAFAGGNHRTAYATAKSFLLRNGRHIRVKDFLDAYLFVKNIEYRSLDEIQQWIEQGE